MFDNNFASLLDFSRHFWAILLGYPDLHVVTAKSKISKKKSMKEANGFLLMFFIDFKFEENL